MGAQHKYFSAFVSPVEKSCLPSSPCFTDTAPDNMYVWLDIVPDAMVQLSSLYLRHMSWQLFREDMKPTVVTNLNRVRPWAVSLETAPKASCVLSARFSCGGRACCNTRVVCSQIVRFEAVNLLLRRLLSDGLRNAHDLVAISLAGITDRTGRPRNWRTSQSRS